MTVLEMIGEVLGSIVLFGCLYVCMVCMLAM